MSRSSDVFECLGPGGQRLILHGPKHLLQNLSLSTCITSAGEERLSSNCFFSFLGCNAGLVSSEPSPYHVSDWFAGHSDPSFTHCYV